MLFRNPLLVLATLTSGLTVQAKDTEELWPASEADFLANDILQRASAYQAVRRRIKHGESVDRWLPIFENILDLSDEVETDKFQIVGILRVAARQQALSPNALDLILREVQDPSEPERIVCGLLDSLLDLDKLDNRTVAVVAAQHSLDSEENFASIRAIGVLRKARPDEHRYSLRLIDLLTHPRESVRWTTADTLGRVGKLSDEELSALRSAIKDNDPAVRTVAANSLWKATQKAEPSRTVLIRELASEDYSLHFYPTHISESDAGHRLYALEGLRQKGADALPAVDAIEALLKDAPQHTARCAVELLAELSDLDVGAEATFQRVSAYHPRQDVRYFAAMRWYQAE